LVCNVARCCGKAVAQDPFYHLQKLLRGIDGISLALDSAVRKVYHGICLAAAFEFAEGTGQPRHLEWASALERKLDGGIPGQPLRTPRKTPSNDLKSKRDGYRWEDGICEWVARTPAGSLKALEEDGGEDGEQDGYDSHTGDPVHSAPSEECGDPPDMSPCLKKRKRGSQEQSRTSQESRRAEITAFAGDWSTAGGSSKDGVSPWNRGSSDIEDLYSAEADELSVSPGHSSSKSSQPSAGTPLEPGSTDSSRASGLPKHSGRRLQGKRVRTTGQLSRATSHATNDLVQPIRQAEESEDELSVA